MGSLAIVDALPGPAADRRLVIARHGGGHTHDGRARPNAAIVGLTAEVPDPRSRTPKTLFLPEQEIAIHHVVGIIFDHSVNSLWDRMKRCW